MPTPTYSEAKKQFYATGYELRDFLARTISGKNPDGTDFDHSGGSSSAQIGAAFDPTLFGKWRKALAQVRLGTANARILCAGDSTTMGGGAASIQLAFPAQLQKFLNSYYVNTVDGAVWGKYSSISDNRLSIGAGWSTAPGATGSSFGNGGFLGNVGASPLAVTFAHAFDRIDVYYVKNTGLGTFTTNVDGGSSLGTTDTSATAGIGKTTFSVSSGTHTINIGGVATSSVFILGVEAYHSTTRSVIVSNAASSDKETTNFVSTASAWDAFYEIGTYAPDLTILSLGVNDAVLSARDAATYKTNLQTIIEQAKLTGDVIIWPALASNPVIYPAATALEAQYAAVAAELAGSMGCGYVDINTRFVDYATASALGFYADHLHPTPVAYVDIAQAMANAITAV